MNDKIKNALSKLILEHPFFGNIAIKLNFKENNSINGVSYRGDILEFNSEYIDALKTDEILSIIATASMKQSLFHSNRGANKIASIWSEASEYAINSILIQNGFLMHPLAKFSKEYISLSAEEIYQLILNQSDIKDEPTNEHEEKIYEDSEFEEFLEQIIKKIENQDSLPKDIDRVIDRKKEPKLSWRELLFNYINSHAKLDYKMFPSNKKYLYRGISLPSISGEILKIAIAIDTSASIDDEKLEQFISEVEDIMQNFQHYEIELIECDYKIQNTQRVTPLTPITSTLKGGGATNFIPVFDYLENLNEDFKFLIYFSDGEGVFPNNKANIDTLWVLTKDITIPFGEKIILD